MEKTLEIAAAICGGIVGLFAGAAAYAIMLSVPFIILLDISRSFATLHQIIYVLYTVAMLIALIKGAIRGAQIFAALGYVIVEEIYAPPTRFWPWEPKY